MSHIWPIWPVSLSDGWKVSSILIGWVPDQQHFLLANSWEWERCKNLATPHYRCELGVDLAGFFTLPRQSGHMAHPASPSCANFPLFSRSGTNYFKPFISLLFVTFISKIIKKLYYCLNLCQFNILDQLILDTGPGVLSHIWPNWQVHTSSGAGQEYSESCEAHCWTSGGV